MFRSTDWRWLGIVAAVLLAACAAPRKTDTPPEAPVAVTPAPTRPVPPPVVEPEPPEPALWLDGMEPSLLASPPDFWTRIRQGLQFTSCAAEDTQSKHWTRRYAGYPERFAKTLDEIAPLMHYVAGELEANDLPLDFVFLPIVESTYHPHRSRGERPAGIWQLMPQTARGFGAPMRPQYDGRLDYGQATFAAMRLLTHLRAQFGDDWKLVNMAFNAGEFRVKNALKGAKGARLAEPRGLSPITIEHFAKLRALGCLIDDPARFGLVLPPFDDSRALAAVPLPEPWPIEFLAHLAGVGARDLQRWNPGLFGTHTPGFPEHRLLLPRSASTTLLAALEPLPRDHSARWQQVVLADPEARAKAAADAGLAETLFAGINRQGGDRVWLPSGSGVPKVLATSGYDPGAVRHRVRPGDTLWAIAKHYRLRVQQIIEWNGLGRKALIKPGQWLRLTAPE